MNGDNYCAGLFPLWLFTALVGTIVLCATGTFVEFYGVSLWGWPVVWNGIVVVALLAERKPWSEEAKIDRQIRRLDRERVLLAKRQELERARAEYESAFDRLLADEPVIPEKPKRTRRIG